MKRVFDSLAFRWVVCVVVNLPFVVQAGAAEVTHDFNANGYVDFRDFASFQVCYTKSLPYQNCGIHDANEDEELTGTDFADFLSALQDPNWIPLPDAEESSAGYPRSWEGALPISDYSVYNLARGNIITTIPIVSWDPVGPPLIFNLYHNSALAAAEKSGQFGQGFDLGDGWSTSYSGRLIFGGSSVTVVEDDGTRHVFSYDDGAWKAPVGVYDRLVQVGSGSESYWLLTRTSQNQRKFNANGRLIEVIDAVGSKLTVARETESPYRITSIATAADGLGSNGNNRLGISYNYDNSRITLTDAVSREWILRLNDGKLVELNYPDDHDIPDASDTFAYDEDGRITRIARRNQVNGDYHARVVWEYQYADSGRLTKVLGPYPDFDKSIGDAPGAPPAGAYEVEFSELYPVKTACVWRRAVEDRRGYEWWFDFDVAAPHGRLLVAQHDPIDVADVSTDRPKRYEYDKYHNITRYTNELGNSWTAEYGPIGNLTKLQGPPLGQQQTRQEWKITWEAVGAAPTNFYRVTRVEDPAGNWVEYEYGDGETAPATAVVKVTEMPDGQGNSAAETTLEYSFAPNCNGHLTRVIDANGVITEYAYDDRGYQSSEEGGFKDIEGRHWWGNPPNRNVVFNDLGGQTGGCDLTGCGEVPPQCMNLYFFILCVDCMWRSGAFPPRLSDSTSNPTPYWEARTICGGATNNDYDVLGRPLSISSSNGCGNTNRSHTFSYDDLGRLETIESAGSGMDPNMLAPTVTLELSFEELEQDPSYDADGRVLRMEDQDGHVMRMTYDACGRVKTVVRNADEVTAFGVEYFYDAAGRIERIENTNGTVEEREYDAADRLTKVSHKDIYEQEMMRVEYGWTINNWMDYRTEYDNTGGTLRTAFVDFACDNRGRLIRETRTEGANDAYDISYAYDQLGNRLSKIDAVAGLWTVYDYDVHEDWDFENEEYGSWDNRLLRYRVYDGNPETGTLLRTVTYTYYQTGQAANITVKDEDPSPDPINGPDPAYDKHRDLALYYYRGGGTLWRALWGEFERDQNGEAFGYVAADAREFSWDSPRARLTTVDFDKGQSQSNDPSQWAIESTHRTDHVGDSPYRDLAAAGAGSPVEYMQYLGTAARQPVNSQGVPTDLEFLHGDLIGSTMTVSDDNGIPKEFPTGGGGGGSGGGGGPAVTSVAYTAFGELLTSTGVPNGSAPEGFTRYQYAGEHGYESGVLSLQGVNTALPPVTLQHVGHRWYQPEIGRFVQRDPIGIDAGTNVYAYCSNAPVRAIDPTGLVPPHGGCLGCGKHFGCTCPVKPPEPPAGPSWPANVETEQEARDIANVATLTMAALAALGGPPGWVTGGVCIVGAWLWDYIDRKNSGVYDPPTGPHGGVVY